MKNYNEISGYVRHAEIRKLQELAHGKDCLEIGAFLGKTTVAMASVAKSVRTVDTFMSDPFGEYQTGKITTYHQFLDNTRGYFNIIPFRGPSVEIVPYLPDGWFDFVFIDGDHTAEGITEDISVCWPKLKPGGVMAFHDYGFYKWPAVKKIVDFLFRVDGTVCCLAWTTK